MAIRNQARRLLSLKEYKDNRRYTYEDIEKATGLSSATISAVLNNKLQYYDMSPGGTVERFCEFLGCTLHDFFVEDSQTEDPQKGQVAELVVVPPPT